MIGQSLFGEPSIHVLVGLIELHTLPNGSTFFFFFLRILSQWFVDNNFIVKNINKEVFESIVEVAPGTKRFHRCQLFFIVNDPDGCCREQLAESLFTVVCVRAEKRKLRGLLLRL